MAGLITMSRRGKNVICKVLPDACLEINRVTHSIVGGDSPAKAVVSVAKTEQAVKKN